ncbi:hypothetical protein IFM89_009523 [Coptis chinensis]|uniref:Uncharacterized protein n=1 Tax=Coptis chinensis TaxID=261450 RepID=A0A835HUN7_9MAGN|nr:hypothetical protein IFM89_009523 [Coptis chinensis]
MMFLSRIECQFKALTVSSSNYGHFEAADLNEKFEENVDAPQMALPIGIAEASSRIDCKASFVARRGQGGKSRSCKVAEEMSIKAKAREQTVKEAVLGLEAKAWFETQVGGGGFDDTASGSWTASCSSYGYIVPSSTNVLGPDSILESTYLYIQMEYCPRQEIAYPQFRLRVHQEWEDGIWTLYSYKEKVRKRHSATPGFSLGGRVRRAAKKVDANVESDEDPKNFNDGGEKFEEGYEDEKVETWWLVFEWSCRLIRVVDHWFLEGRIY